MSGPDVVWQSDEFSEPTIELPQPWQASGGGTIGIGTPGVPPIPAVAVPTSSSAPIMPATPVEPWQGGLPAVSAPPRGRRWPLPAQLLVLLSVVAASAVFGYASYRTVAGIGLSAYGWSEVSGWSWGILFGAVATLVAAVVAVVALVRTQSSRLVAVISLMVALFLPPIALYAGGRLGFDVAAATVSSDLVSFTSDGTAALALDWLMRLISQ